MDKIIRKLAAKYNLDDEIIEKIIRTEFRFVAETMQQGEFQSVHLHYLGKWAVRPRAVETITKKRENYLKSKDASKVNNDI